MALDCMALDCGGNAYVTGAIASSNLITTMGAPQGAYAGGRRRLRGQAGRGWGRRG